MQRELLCPHCREKLGDMHPEDVANKFKRRIVPVIAKKPERHEVKIQSSDMVQTQVLPSLKCDHCGEIITDGSPAFAVTMYQGDEPGSWEHEYEAAPKLKLTSDNVFRIFHDCLFNEEEDKSTMVEAACIIHKFGFHPARLEAHRAEIAELLHQLHPSFRRSVGGGWTFLNAHVADTGEQWGEHANVEMLLGLGLATKQVEYCMPREVWKIMPGGMPYFAVL